jgi:hypothetical protein
MMKLFDYVYYRIYVFFLERKDNIPETTGWMLLSLLHFFSLLTIAAFLTFIVNVDSFNKYYALLVIIPLMAYNWYRYERDFDIKKYESRWGDEPKTERRKKGWLIVVYFAVVVLIPVSIGVLRHNLGLID